MKLRFFHLYFLHRIGDFKERICAFKEALFVDWKRLHIRWMPVCGSWSSALELDVAFDDG